jgi:hypothetical protein
MTDKTNSWAGLQDNRAGEQNSQTAHRVTGSLHRCENLKREPEQASAPETRTGEQIHQHRNTEVGNHGCNTPTFLITFIMILIKDEIHWLNQI